MNNSQNKDSVIDEKERALAEEERIANEKFLAKERKRLASERLIKMREADMTVADEDPLEVWDKVIARKHAIRSLMITGTAIIT